MTGVKNENNRIPGIQLAILHKFSTLKFSIDNENIRSYNRSITASAHEIGRNTRMDKKQAKELIYDLTYEEKLLLRELLLSLRQMRSPEQSPEELGQKVS